MYKPFFLLNNDIEVMIISQLLWNSDSIHTCVYYLTNLVSNLDTNNSDMFFNYSDRLFNKTEKALH